MSARVLKDDVLAREDWLDGGEAAFPA
jgi:hypothetical protein